MVARRQLGELGLSRRAIDGRVERGRLHVIHRGVYAVGYRKLTVSGRWMAATLAVAGVLSHRDAAALHGIRRDHRLRIDVTVPAPRTRPGLDRHQAHLAPDEIEEIDGIPVTTLHRTILDLAAVTPEDQVEAAMARAVRQRLTDAIPLRTLLDRHPRRPGTPMIRRILARRSLGRRFTRSGFEEAFGIYADRHRLGRPDFNVHVDTGERLEEVDALYPHARIAIELDSREWHDNPISFATDRAKSRRLAVAGYRPIRVAPEHLETADLARDLRSMLA